MCQNNQRPSSLKMLPGFSSQDTVSDKPASFTFHNISLENSPLIVECVNSNEDISRAMIFVEGKGTIMNNVMQNKWGIEGVPICMTHNPCSFVCHTLAYYYSLFYKWIY